MKNPWNGKTIVCFGIKNRWMSLDPLISDGGNLITVREECRRKGLSEAEVCPVEYGRDKHIILPLQNQ